MRTHGRWVLLPLLAVLLTACSSGAASTPVAAVPVTAPAVTGTGTAAASAAATVGPPTPAATLPSVEPATPVPATPVPKPAPTPPPTRAPTPTQRAATPPPATGGQAVNISNFAFVPATVTVKVGTRVTWLNRQAGVQHTVTAGDGSFGSAALSTGSSYSHVFTKAGTFTYHCAIHPFMTGTVIVIG